MIKILKTFAFSTVFYAAVAGAAYAPNRVVVELETDSSDVLVDAAGALADLYGRYGTPEREKLYPQAGDSRTAVEQRWNAVAERFARRAKRQTRARRVPALNRFWVLTFPDGQADMERIAGELREIPGIRGATPDYYMRTQLAPDDAFYGTSGSWGNPYADLWGLKNIKMEEAWEKTTGSAGVTVAVVDTGVDWDHEDLSENMHRNEAELNGEPGVDDDGNGWIDDVHGYDFVDGDPEPEDLVGHGTHVAGTIAAVGDNGLGVAGVMWQAKIMGIRVLGGTLVPPAPGDPTGFYGAMSKLAQGLIYAADNGADVVNMSLGTIFDVEETFYAAVQYADSLGVVMVAAAGNDSINSSYYYPAGYPEMITVGSSSVDDEKSSFSSYGENVDVVAPGGGDGSGVKEKQYNVLSLRATGTNMLGKKAFVVGEKYILAAGTSMAAPHVAGLAGLILSAQADLEPPLSVEEIRQVLRTGSQDFGDEGWDNRWGYGRIDAPKALDQASFCEARILFPGRHALVQKSPFEMQVHVGGHDLAQFSVAISKGGQGESWSAWQEVKPPAAPTAVGEAQTIAVAPSLTGRYLLRLQVHDAAGAVCAEDHAPFQFSSLKAAHVLTFANAEGRRLGEKLAVGDVNADGFDDLLIGAPVCSLGEMSDKPPCFALSKAQVFLVYGQPSWPPEIDVTDASWAPASWISESLDNFTDLDQLGFSLATLDIDNDARDDVLLGYSSDSNSGKKYNGRVCVFLGKNSIAWTQEMTWSAADFCFIGEGTNDALGFHLINGGDLNADGLDDIAVSSNSYGENNAGRVYVIYGGSVGDDWSLETPIKEAADVLLNGTASTVFLSETYGEGLGLVAPGDVTGDGIDDLLISSMYEETFLVPGSVGGIESVDLDEAGWQFTSVGKIVSFWRRDAAGIGDVNGDGINDLLSSFLGITTPAGFQIVYGGSAKEYGNKLALNQIEHPFFLERYYSDILFKPIVDVLWSSLQKPGVRSYLGLGDVNGDGRDDFLSGSAGYDVFPSTGIIYGFYGSQHHAGGLAVGVADFAIKEPDLGPQTGHFGKSMARGRFFGGSSYLVVGAPRASGPRVYLCALEDLKKESAPATDADWDGVTVEQGDCNDLHPSVFPGAPEICDEHDNDCDGSTDEGFPALGQACGDPSQNACLSYVYRCGSPTAVKCEGVPLPYGVPLPNPDNLCQSIVCSVNGKKTKNVPSGTPCDDGIYCNGAESCNGSGSCVSTPLPVLSDGIGCTQDLCDEETKEITHVPDDGLCQDANSCTVDECSASTGCQHKAVGGGLPNLCGGCAFLMKKPGVPCETDGNPCTKGTYVCSGIDDTVCMEKSLKNGTACSDGDACTVGDACQEGTCLASGKVFVNDGNPCTDDSCVQGQVFHAPNESLLPADGQACTLDQCQDGYGYFPAPWGTPCGDGLVCDGTHGFCPEKPSAAPPIELEPVAAPGAAEEQDFPVSEDPEGSGSSGGAEDPTQPLENPSSSGEDGGPASGGCSLLPSDQGKEGGTKNDSGHGSLISKEPDSRLSARRSRVLPPS